jgi:hypothetical protein
MATIRKQHGHYLEDFEPGALLRHKGGRRSRKVSSRSSPTFVHAESLSKNVAMRERTAIAAWWFRPVSSWPSSSARASKNISENARANLEYIDMRFGAPVCVGDTLEAETLILSVKPSTKNLNLGVVHVQTTGRNQDGEVVLTFQRKVQVWKKNPQARVDDREVRRARSHAPSRRRRTTLRGLQGLRTFQQPGHVLEDFKAGDVYEQRARPRHHNRSHHADGDPRQHVPGALQPVDDRPGSRALCRGQLIVFGGIPFQLCLGLSSADVGTTRSATWLRDGTTHRTVLRRRHALCEHGDPCDARPSGSAGPRVLDTVQRGTSS